MKNWPRSNHLLLAQREKTNWLLLVRVSEVQMHHTEHGKQTERIAVKDSVFIKHQNIVITEFWSIKIIVSNWQWVLVTLKLDLLFWKGFVTPIYWPWSFPTRDVCCPLQYHCDFFRVPVKTWAWVSHQGQVEKCRWKKVKTVIEWERFICFFDDQFLMFACQDSQGAGG